MIVWAAGLLSSSTRKTLYALSNCILSRFLCNVITVESLSSSIPNPQRLVSYLNNCSNISSLRQTHACLIVFGLQRHIFLGSKLLNCYARHGCLAESRWVFNRIINRNLSLWNTILVGYFRSAYCNEVLRLYSNLKQLNIGVDSSTLTVILKSCTELGTVGFGRQIHADAFKFRLNIDGHVGSSLIGFYSKCGVMEYARQVFEEMSHRDVVTHTAMITAYAQIADTHSYEAFRIVRFMQKEGLDPNRVTLISLLQVASQLQLLEKGRVIHGYAVRRGFGCFDEILETSLTDMYIKCGALDVAESIFQRMNSRTVASWNAMVAGYVQIGQPLKGLNLFHCFMREKNEPDLITLANGLLGCADLKLLHQGKSIHAYVIRTGAFMDLIAITALVDMYSKCNSLNNARKLFDKEESRDLILYNVMISGYLETGLADKAMETFYRMMEAGIRPNSATMFSILSASADLTDIRAGMAIHGYTVRQSLEPNTEISNQILHMYSKCDRIDVARKIFNRITSRDLVSWTSMMLGCANHGLADEALELFPSMQSEGMKPDSVTLISLLMSSSHLGYLKLAEEIHAYAYRIQLEKDIRVINALATSYAKCGRLDIAMVLFEHNVRPDQTLWNTMIAAYGMHGNCLDSLALFKRMQGVGVKPNELTFTSLLSACSHGGLVEEGLFLFRSMIDEHCIIPCEEHYSCMVDLLGRAGRLEEAYHLLSCFPPRDNISGLTALLAACRVYKNLVLGEVVGRKLMDLKPESSSAYACLSNMYAEAGKWSEVARLRTIAKSQGLKKQPGFSMII